ncbi:DUF4474 domain-containing protein [Mobilitalea sibirica]|uniref:DUF4474 domain-containing protein n=1 Tax=Mobilitalea sibirica TaxID=1462919 RepID=A0A8J7KX64_9FIRM|nr:DUF4474 domain-containing protein [Mobilitalea sibirica]MBH1941397.1 DUF4474 domain-containing protein [Mobilitalea sibirica]
MLEIQVGSLISGIVNASALWLLYTQNKVLVILGLLGLLFIVSIFYRIRKKKKKKQEPVVIRPITDVIGTNPERLAILNKDLSPFGFAYEPLQDFFYSLMDGWQRKFGYCRLYDEASATLSMIIDCEPIYFEYAGKKWLIEFWKGQYGMTTGGEVGVYYTTGPDLNIPGVFNGTFYFALKDEDRINMSFAFRKNGNLLFTRSAYHWWITGFKLGEFSYPSELTMDIIMDLYDYPMAVAFAKALMKAGYTEEEFAVRGPRVFIHFDKPHTPQPFTRKPLTEFLAQKNNRSFCNSYNKLTQAYTDTVDKLTALRSESPDMYDRALNIGKTRKVFEAYNKIKDFIEKDEE